MAYPGGGAANQGLSEPQSWHLDSQPDVDAPLGQMLGGDFQNEAFFGCSEERSVFSSSGAAPTPMLPSDARDLMLAFQGLSQLPRFPTIPVNSALNNGTVPDVPLQRALLTSPPSPAAGPFLTSLFEGFPQLPQMKETQFTPKPQNLFSAGLALEPNPESLGPQPPLDLLEAQLLRQLPLMNQSPWDPSRYASGIPDGNALDELQVGRWMNRGVDLTTLGALGGQAALPADPLHFPGNFFAGEGPLLGLISASEDSAPAGNFQIRQNQFLLPQQLPSISLHPSPSPQLPQNPKPLQLPRGTPWGNLGTSLLLQDGPELRRKMGAPTPARYGSFLAAASHGVAASRGTSLDIATAQLAASGEEEQLRKKLTERYAAGQRALGERYAAGQHVMAATATGTNWVQESAGDSAGGVALEGAKATGEAALQTLLFKMLEERSGVTGCASGAPSGSVGQTTSEPLLCSSAKARGSSERKEAEEVDKRLRRLVGNREAARRLRRRHAERYKDLEEEFEKLQRKHGEVAKELDIASQRILELTKSNDELEKMAAHLRALVESSNVLSCV